MNWKKILKDLKKWEKEDQKLNNAVSNKEINLTIFDVIGTIINIIGLTYIITVLTLQILGVIH